MAIGKTQHEMMVAVEGISVGTLFSLATPDHRGLVFQLFLINICPIVLCIWQGSASPHDLHGGKSLIE